MNPFVAPFAIAGLVALATVGPARATGPEVSLTPTSLDYGTQQVGSDSSDYLITVTNTGDSDVSFGPSAVTLAGAGSGNFRLRGELCSSRTLSVGMSCAVYVGFHPEALGLTTARLVVASDAAGSPDSVPLRGTGIRVPTDPGPPRSVVATPGNSRVVVRWLPPLDDGGLPIDGYRVTAAPGGRTCVTAGARTCVVTGLTNGDTYRFRVVATNTGPDGDFGAASPPSAGVTPAGPPTAPRTVTAVAGRRSATVTWLPPSDSGGTSVTGYRVRATRGTATCSTVRTRCTLRHLPRHRIRFTVRAVNRVGGSPASTPSNAVRPR
ncbi:MAG: fibronectin type III domain-containing protein [Candidatus Nanopelagicales bacterium]